MIRINLLAEGKKPVNKKRKKAPAPEELTPTNRHSAPAAVRIISDRLSGFDRKNCSCRSASASSSTSTPSPGVSGTSMKPSLNCNFPPLMMSPSGSVHG